MKEEGSNGGNGCDTGDEGKELGVVWISATGRDGYSSIGNGKRWWYGLIEEKTELWGRYPLRWMEAAL